MVSLCLKANAEMVPKIPSCHYMLLMYPSRLKSISNQFYYFVYMYDKITMPPGDNPIAVNNNNNNNNNMPLHVSSTVVLIIMRSTLHYTASGVVTLCR